MKHIVPSSSPCRPVVLLLAVLLTLAGLSLDAASHELVRNGSFAQVMAEWGIPPEVQPWYPYQHPAGRVALHPDTMGYEGTVLYQSLNVTGIAGQSVEAAVDLGAEWALPPGQSYALYVEYLDDTETRRYATLINPSNAAIPAGAMQTFTGSFTFPGNATKLVGLAIEKNGFGNAYADNVSLTSPVLTGGPVPVLQGVSPQAVLYGGSVTLTGTHFGATRGSVSIGGSTAGVVINSWTDTQIVLTLNDPCMGGAVIVTAAGVHTTQQRGVGIATPHFRVRTDAGPHVATPGQTVRVPVFVDFRSGFSPAQGPVTLTAPTPPAPVTFLPAAVTGHGGSYAVVDTSALPAGTHTFTVQGTAPGTLLPRSATFDLEVHTVSNVVATYFSAASNPPLNGAVFNAQGEVSLGAQILDQSNTDIAGQVPFPAWSTSNPSVAEIFMDPMPWGGAKLFVHASGTATITVTLPDGANWSFPITVTLPPTPRVLSHAFSEWITDNTGSTQNSAYFLADGVLSYFSYGVYTLGVDFEGGNWGDGGMSYNGLFRVKEGQNPGQYHFYATGNTALGTLNSSIKLTVVNAPTKGLANGRVAISGSQMGHGEASGELEFYDATTGTLAFTRSVWSMTSDFTSAYLTPGSYKLRWISSAPGVGNGLTQWYPNAASISEAQPVTVAAGGTLGEVNFFLNPVEQIPVAPVITQAPAMNPTAQTFTLQTLTESGVTYLLQKSFTLNETSWFTVATLYGNGAAQSLEDAQASEPSAFYRIVRLN
jgi:hypothetical protein